jgi:O-antigen/teichoic acid export membrane protein
MHTTLKQKTVRGIGWSSIERFSTQGISFCVQIILARLLTPSEYGIIGMLAIFMQLAQVLIDSGFANALIRKNNCTEKEYSTVFYYNLLLSSLVYLCFFIIAPFVANFYQVPDLVIVMRYLSITLIFNALSIIHKTILIKEINFRLLTKISVIGAIVSGGVGITLATHNFGVWALVAQQIVSSITTFVLFIIHTKWKPTYFFCKEAFQELYGFGSKLLLSSIISTIYRNLYTLCIGKKFSTIELGHYSRAEQFAMFPSSNISNIIARVAYPVFSKIQNDNDKLKIFYKKIISYTSYIIFPLMIGLIAIAKPFILTFLTEKWLGVVTLLQILCIDWMFDHLSVINLNLLYVKGRSDLALRLEIIKKTIAIIILIISLQGGIVAVCWGRVIYSIIATLINTYYTNKLIQLKFTEQIMDILPYLIASTIMGAITYGSIYNIDSPWLQLVIGVFIGVLVYSIITLLFFKNIINEIKSLAINRQL